MALPLRTPFHVMAKPIGPLCNLRCRYCFYLEKEALYAPSRWQMPDEVLEQFIAGYIASQDTPVISFAWQGGEPTMLGLGFFERVVELQRRHCPKGRTIENSFQTNGTLIDAAWAAFLARERFLTGISIDGPADLHDHYRVDRGGQPSHARVMAGIEHLHRARAEFNTLTVVNRRNVKEPRRVYQFLKGIGSTFLQFIPVVERLTGPADAPRLSGPPTLPGTDGTLAPWCPRGAEWGDFLNGIFDLWIEADVGRVFVQLFDVQLGIFAGMPSTLCVFSPICGGAVALEHNGDVYACDHFVYPQYRLGNLMEGNLRTIVEQERQRRFGADKWDRLPGYCRACPWLAHCHGECPKHRIATTPDGEPGLNHLCEGYRAFFEHTAPSFRRMAELLGQRRAPAEVMLERHERQFEEERRFGRVGRNDPCPCGSGKKFKHCHGRGR